VGGLAGAVNPRKCIITAAKRAPERPFLIHHVSVPGKTSVSGAGFHLFLGFVGINVKRTCFAFDHFGADHHVLNTLKAGKVEHRVEQNTCSMIERSPRAPVLRSMALRAIARSASSGMLELDLFHFE
jgi:hypothetical protein